MRHYFCIFRYNLCKIVTRSHVSNKWIWLWIYFVFASNFFQLDRSTGRAVWFLWVCVLDSSARSGLCGSGYWILLCGLVFMGLSAGVTRAVWFPWVWVRESSARSCFCGPEYKNNDRTRSDGFRPNGLWTHPEWKKKTRERFPTIFELFSYPDPQKPDRAACRSIIACKTRAKHKVNL